MVVSEFAQSSKDTSIPILLYQINPEQQCNCISVCKFQDILQSGNSDDAASELSNPRH